LNVPFIETDLLIEELFHSEEGKNLSCNDIYSNEGEDKFIKYELKAVRKISHTDWDVISTGGRTILHAESKQILLKNSICILLKAPDEFLWDRIKNDRIPSFLSGEDGFEKYKNRNKKIYESVEHLADIIYHIPEDNKIDMDDLIGKISSVILLRMDAPNSFGEIIKTTTFGESHGPAIGAVLDGIKPGVELSENDIQSELDKRRPGQSAVTTSRDEKDKVHILSGVYDGKTTGTPICMMIYNKDQDPSKYDALKDIFRPGHADFTFWKKYGIRDHRGGGRSSGRETAARVAAGSIAKKILKESGIEIIAFSEEIAGIKGEREETEFIEKNRVRSADPEKAMEMEQAITNAIKEKDSVGGIVKLLVKNLPPGTGDPVFYKLEARLSMALFSIGAVKGVEFGTGFGSARMRGSENNDQMSDNGFVTNNAGGVLGGISTGQDVIARIAVKPTPSIFQKQETIDTEGKNREIEIKGRHDPCIVPRIIPVVESMTALVILDAIRINDALAK
jgi:chorismate synthase